MSEVLLIIAALILMITVARWREARNYNHGFCQKCGNRLQLMDEDSQGGRGYLCRKCGYVTWCSYSVDKEG
jgi:DNA-directed RNA polymerase subunit RPC12/RpoP